MPALIAIVAGLGLALGGTVVLFIFVLPDKKRDRLPGFFKVLHDILNMKFLIIEKTIKFFYVFCTLACIMVGFLMLMSRGDRYFEDDLFDFDSLAPLGLIVLFVGPIVFRLIYEGFMQIILLVKNTMEINQKLKKPEDIEKIKTDFEFPYSLKRAPRRARKQRYLYHPQPDQLNYGGQKYDTSNQDGSQYDISDSGVSQYDTSKRGTSQYNRSDSDALHADTSELKDQKYVAPNFGTPDYSRSASRPAAEPGETTVMGPKTCRVCGSPLKENDKFCLNCGTRVGG